MSLFEEQKKIAVYGCSEYALMEAFLLSHHHRINLIYKNKQAKEKINSEINQSQELKFCKKKLNSLPRILIDEMKQTSPQIILFFDGLEKEFEQLISLQAKQEFVIIDCSSYDWQLKRMQKQKFSHSVNQNYFVLAQYVQKGQLYEQLNKRNNLVIGSSRDDEITKELFHSIYQPFLDVATMIKIGDIQSVYLSKFVLNTQLAFRIAVMNEAARICEIIGADIEIISQCIGLDHRIGSKYLKAGAGFGGTSFMKDLDFLAHFLNENDKTSHSLFKDVIKANEDHQEVLFRKIWHYYDMNLKGKTISLWGLSYKPDTPDISLSPAIRVIEILISQGVNIQCFDPMIQKNHLKTKFDRADLKKIKFSEDPIKACLNSDGLLIFNELNLFKNIDLITVKEKMRNPLIFDGRNLFEIEVMKKAGLTYFSVGR